MKTCRGECKKEKSLCEFPPVGNMCLECKRKRDRDRMKTPKGWVRLCHNKDRLVNLGVTYEQWCEYGIPRATELSNMYPGCYWGWDKSFGEKITEGEGLFGCKQDGTRTKLEIYPIVDGVHLLNGYEVLLPLSAAKTKPVDANLKRIREVHKEEIKKLNNDGQCDILEGFVYAITNPAWKNEVKIGSSIDPEVRIRQFQTGCPYRDYKLEFFHYFTDRKKAENAIHLILDEQHTNGEWFAITLDVAIETIKNYTLPFVAIAA